MKLVQLHKQKDLKHIHKDHSKKQELRTTFLNYCFTNISHHRTDKDEFKESQRDPFQGAPQKTNNIQCKKLQSIHDVDSYPVEKNLTFLLPFLIVWAPTLHLLCKPIPPISCIHSPMNAVSFTTESALPVQQSGARKETIYTSIMPCYIRFVLCKAYLAKSSQLKSLNMNAGSGSS